MSKEMRVLTLWQPWASLVVMGWKKYETRSWSTPYRGTLLIHAAKRPVKNKELSDIACKSDGQFSAVFDMNFPLGAILGCAELTDVRKMTETEVSTKNSIPISSVSSQEKAVGVWLLDRYAWELNHPITFLSPIAYEGAQGLRKLHPHFGKIVKDAMRGFQNG